MSRRTEIIDIARQHSRAIDKTRRIYLEEPSFAIGQKKSLEYDIKSEISKYYKIPFRTVLFCGSAHLGFSPHKDTDFVPGESDLDVALIDMRVFQEAWITLNEATRALTDLSGFRFYPDPEKVVEEVRLMMIKRGLLHLDKMPKCGKFDKDRQFLDELSKAHRSMFPKISVTFYMNEYAFCWKQNSAIKHILR